MSDVWVPALISEGNTFVFHIDESDNPKFDDPATEIKYTFTVEEIREDGVVIIDQGVDDDRAAEKMSPTMLSRLIVRCEQFEVIKNG